MLWDTGLSKEARDGVEEGRNTDSIVFLEVPN
jgi:hypothetical protein